MFSQSMTDGFFVNPAYTQNEPSIFGDQEVFYFECIQDILFDGSPSMGEDNYFIELTEFDLSTWTAVQTFFSDWICITPCTAPNNIDVLSYFGAATPQCGTIYKFRLATGPSFDAIDRFFGIDCGSQPVVNTFSSKLTTVEFDPATLPNSRDFCHSAYEDPSNFDIKVAGYTNGTGSSSGDFNYLAVNLDYKGDKQLFDRSSADPVYEQINYNNPAGISCSNTGLSYNGMLMTGVRGDDFWILIENTAGGSIAYDRSFSGSPSQTEVGNHILQAPNGEIIAVGYATDGINSDVWAIELDECLEPTFIRQYSLSANSRAEAVAVIRNPIDPATGAPIPGYHYLITGRVGNDILLMAINGQTGDPLFTDYYRYDLNNGAADIGKDIILDQNGDIVITGTTIRQIPGPFGNDPLHQPFVMRVLQGDGSASGWALVNQVAIVDIQNSLDESSHSIVQAANGDFILTGYAYANYSVVTPVSGVYDEEAHLTRISSDFSNAIFSNAYSNGATSTVGERVSLTSTGRLLLAGYCTTAYGTFNAVYDNDVYLVSTDSLGQLDNCNCFEAGNAIMDQADYTEMAETILSVDLTNPGTTNNLMPAAFDFPYDFCEQYCPPPPANTGCSVNGCPTTPVLNISTGIDAGGVPLPFGTVDPYWQTMNFPPLGGPPPTGFLLPNAYAIQPFPSVPGWNDIPGLPLSRPVSPGNQAAFGTNNQDTLQPWRIRREFCLCDSSQVLISGSMRSDDQGQLWLYDDAPTPNATLLATTSPALVTANFLQNWPINWTGTLPPGTYHLEFEVRNSQQIAMGFAVAATITNITNSATLSNPDVNCCSNGVISVQKIDDQNCNGLRDSGEPGLQGWTFNLTNTTTSQTYTGITNAFGEVIFRQLPYGTYTVTEVVSSPWMPTAPPGGTQTVVISAANPIQIVDFLNKNPENCDCIDQSVVNISNAGAPNDECCCFELLVDNNYGLYYDEIELVANGFSISLLNNTSGLTPISSTGNSIRISSTIPVGTGQSMFTFCTDDLFGAGTVTVNWYNSGNLICDTDVPLSCEKADIIIQTFDVTHRLHTDTLTDLFDLGLAGFQDQNGDFVSIGHTQTPGNNEIELALAKYDYTGAVSATPQMSVYPNPNLIEVIDAEEIVDASGANDGYLVLLSEQSPDYGIFLARLDQAGAVLWVDEVQVGLTPASPFPARPYDFLINGNLAVITGEANTGSTIEPFIASYDYVLRLNGCGNVFNIDPGTAQITRGMAISNNIGQSTYAIAGQKDNDLIYFEVDYNCQFATGNTHYTIPVDGNNTSPDIPVKILFDANDQPFICGYVDGGLDRLFIKQGKDAITYYQANTQLVLTDAIFNEQGHIILSGTRTEDGGERHGFLKGVEPITAIYSSGGMLWSKEYYDSEYPETSIQEIDLAHDFGIYTVGFGVQNNSAPFFDLEFYDTWVMKTDPEGNLNECDCYQDITWLEEPNPDSTGLAILNNISEGVPTNIPFLQDSLLHAEYVCDRSSPDTCLISSVLLPLSMPGDSTCCFALDLYNQNNFAYYIQIDINTPSVFFDYASVSSAINLFSYSPQSIVIDNSGSPLPPGSSPNYFQFCLGNWSSTIFFQQYTIRYLDVFGNEIVECRQELETECELICTDDPCVDITNISVECDSLTPGQFLFTYQVTNQTGTSVINQLNWTLVNPIGTALSMSNVPITPDLNPGNTTPPLTLDIFDSGPSYPKQIDLIVAASGYVLGSPDSLFCCHELKDTISIILPNCCNPCDTTWVEAEAIPSIDGECCYNLDILNVCENRLSSIRVSSLSPGVNLGSHWNPNFPATWNFMPTSSTSVVWTYTGGGFAPPGAYTDLIHFCLDNYGGVPNPMIRVEYITTNLNGVEEVLCVEDIELECDQDIKCLDVVSHQVYCDDAGNYFLDFCVDNNSLPPFIANELQINKLSSTPADLGLSQYVFSGAPDFPFGPADPDICLTVPIVGIINTPMAGDQLALEFRLKSLAGDSCCIESDTLLLTLPVCSEDLCCTDSLGFINAVDNGFVLNHTGNTVIVENMLLDACQQVSIEWGDGLFDQLTADMLPINHTYASLGTATVCIFVTETKADGTLCWERSYCETISSVRDLGLSENLNLYPNPTTGWVIIEHAEGKPLQELILLDLLGQPILQRSGENRTRIQMDMKGLPPGVYLVQVKTMEGRLLTKRLVKQ